MKIQPKKKTPPEGVIKLVVYQNDNRFEININKQVMDNMHDLVKNDPEFLIALIKNYLMTENNHSMKIDDKKITLTLRGKIALNGHKKNFEFPIILPITNVSKEDMMQYQIRKLREDLTQQANLLIIYKSKLEKMEHILADNGLSENTQNNYNENSEKQITEEEVEVPRSKKSTKNVSFVKSR